MGKSYFIIAILLAYSFILPGQNLVPNPSFETITSCPPGNSGLGAGYCPPWQRPPGSFTTPDLFHACSSAGTGCSNCNVPNNFGGVSTAWHGVAYAGVITYYTGCPNCREYIQVQLSAPLVAGTVYQVRFRVKLGSRSRYGTNRIGFLLSNSAVSQPGNQPIATPPTYEYPSQILDMTNWTLVNLSYVASGGERWFTTGNFRNNAGTNVFNFGSSSGSCALATAGATYFFDSVYVGEAVVLPSRKFSFSVKGEKEDALLSWEDGGDWPPDAYVVEHATEGESFTELKEIEGKLFRDASYRLRHVSPGLGQHYYRIKSIGSNGQSSYSEVKRVTFGWVDPNLEVFPNPARDRVTLRLELSANENVNGLQLYDHLGRMVFEKPFAPAGGSYFETEVSLAGLKPAVYLLRLRLDNQVVSRRLIVQ